VSGGIIIEEFIEGPEFTVLIVGSSDKPDECTIYPPVQRVFHHSLPEAEKFLSFERLWEFYEEENAIEGNGDFYNYHKAPQHLASKLCSLSLNAYSAVKGQGYTRVDIRMDSASGEMYVLEVNAQCGLSEDENFTSIGAILRLSGSTFEGLIEDILRRALEKSALKIAV
jgi:D-alanine-D-alanine ligase